LKVQTGMRVDKFVFDCVKEVCKGERLMVGEAVQRLMEVCLKAEGLVDAGQRKADELKLKGALAELGRAGEAGRNGMLRLKIGRHVLTKLFNFSRGYASEGLSQRM